MITNKYSRLYHRIIASAQNRAMTEGYKERHHIIPKSLGGTDSKSNLVDVTAREHFILHYLLTKFTEGPDFRKMVNAFNMMNCSSDGQRRYMNSRLYDANRKHMSATMRINQTGARNSQFGKIWMTNPIVGISKKFDIKNLNDAIEQGWCIGRNRKEQKEFIKKIAITQGKTIKIGKDGFIIQTKELFFFRDYVLDGWRMIHSKNEPKLYGKKSIRSKIDNTCIFVNQDIAEEFVRSNMWSFGSYMPNHKGTKGKTYSIHNGKRIYSCPLKTVCIPIPSQSHKI